MTRKPVYLSNLAMRFYEGDGWTKKELDSLCELGQVWCKHPEDEFPYFTLDIGARFHVMKLAARISEVVFPSLFTEHEKARSVEQTIEEYNW